MYPHSRRFSGATHSVVHVIKMANVELIAIFDAIEVTIKRTSLSKGVTEEGRRKQKISCFPISVVSLR